MRGKDLRIAAPNALSRCQLAPARPAVRSRRPKKSMDEASPSSVLRVPTPIANEKGRHRSNFEELCGTSVGSRSDTISESVCLHSECDSPKSECRPVQPEQEPEPETRKPKLKERKERWKESDQLSGFLWQKLSTIEPTTDYLERCQACLAQIKSLANVHFSTAESKKRSLAKFGETISYVEVKPVGSYAQGTNLVCSDLDVSIQMTTSSVGFRSPSWFGDKLTTFGDFLDKECKTVNGSISIFRKKQLILTSRVPVLKLEFLVSERSPPLAVDVCIVDAQENRSSLRRDDVVRRMLEAAGPNGVPLCRLVKHWAKTRGLNSAFEGSLNSVTWAMLVVAYLQECGFVPAYAGLGSWRRMDDRYGLFLHLRDFFRWLTAVGQEIHRGVYLVFDVLQNTRVPMLTGGGLVMVDPDGAVPVWTNTAHTLSIVSWQSIMAAAWKSMHALFSPHTPSHLLWGS